MISDLKLVRKADQITLCPWLLNASWLVKEFVSCKIFVTWLSCNILDQKIAQFVSCPVRDNLLFQPFLVFFKSFFGIQGFIMK